MPGATSLTSFSGGRRSSRMGFVVAVIENAYYDSLSTSANTVSDLPPVGGLAEPDTEQVVDRLVKLFQIADIVGRQIDVARLDQLIELLDF